jgi:hypothetical protein
VTLLKIAEYFRFLIEDFRFEECCHSGKNRAKRYHKSSIANHQ